MFKLVSDYKPNTSQPQTINCLKKDINVEKKDVKNLQKLFNYYKKYKFLSIMVIVLSLEIKRPELVLSKFFTSK